MKRGWRDVIGHKLHKNMATVTLNAYSKAYPGIANRIRASVLSWDKLTVIASITETGAHLARLWSFAGLARNNYVFSLDEIDGGGIVINNLAEFDVTPGELDGSIVRDDEQYQVGAALSGLVTGATSATFDGTAGVPDFRGWNVVPSFLTERGILVRGLDYSWDTDLGIFALLQAGDTFQANMWTNWHFDSKTNTAGNSVPSVFDYSIRFVDTTGDIEYDDFGNALLAEPAGVYMEQNLPEITSVPIGRVLRIIFGGITTACTKIVPSGANSIQFLKGNIIGIPGEWIDIVRFHYSTGVNQWKVVGAFGNFARVGDTIYCDQIQAQMFGAKLLDGSKELVTQYARIYNEVVLNLPGAQVCAFDDHATGLNKYLFSLAKVGGPDDGKFYFPDRRGLTIKSNNIGKAGDFEDWQELDHQHEQASGVVPSTLFGRGIVARLLGAYNGLATSVTDLVSKPISSAGVPISKIGSEIRVASVLNNQYILI